MAKETEVFKLDLDTAALEKKLARIEQLISEIKSKRGKGGDASDLERNLNKELDGLAKLGQQEKKATGTTEDLVKQKDRLGASMRLAGSSASGAVGDIGALIELLMTGQKAAIGMAAALGGLAVGGAVISGIRNHLRKIVEEQDKIAGRFQKMKEAMEEPQVRMAGVLERHGALTTETERDVDVRRARLEAVYGRDVAVEIAPLATIGQQGVPLTEAEESLAAQLTVMGVDVGGAGEVRARIAELEKQKADLVAAARRQMETRKGTQEAVRREKEAYGPGRIQYSREELAFADVKKLGEIGEDVTFSQFKRDLDKARRISEAVAREERGGKPATYRDIEPNTLWPVGEVGKETELGGLMFDFQMHRQRTHGRHLLAAYERAEPTDPRILGPGQAPAPVYHINIAGTQNIAPPTAHIPRSGSIGLSSAVTGKNSYATPLGGG